MKRAWSLIAFTLVGFLAGLSFYRSDSPMARAVRNWCGGAAASVASAFGGGGERRAAAAEGPGGADAAAAEKDKGAADPAAAAVAKREAALKAVERAAKREAELQAEADRLAAEIAESERLARDEAASGRSPLHVKTGASRVETGKDGKPHIASVRGLEFGSLIGYDDRLKPYMTVKDTEAGREFKGLRWRSDVRFDDGGAYGFDRAWLDHTYDTKELSSVTFHREFKMDEGGMDAALEFYADVMEQVQNDLGVELKFKDNTAKTKSASLYSFSGVSEGTDIGGGVSTWSDGTLHVTLRIGDKAFKQELSAQGRSAYERNDAGLETTRIAVSNRDHSSSHQKATALIEAVR